MKYLKTYELFGASSITSAALKDLEAGLHQRNELMMIITSKEFPPKMKKFNKLLKEINLEEVDNDGNTALLLAADYGRLTMMKKLIEAGANIYHTNKKGQDFYDLACSLSSGNTNNKFGNKIKEWIEYNLPEFVTTKKYNI